LFEDGRFVIEFGDDVALTLDDPEQLLPIVLFYWRSLLELCYGFFCTLEVGLSFGE
jgi:hypothetical protein